MAEWVNKDEQEARELLRQAVSLPFGDSRVPTLVAAAQVHAMLAVLTELRKSTGPMS